MGHETDTTLIDLAADLRAPTPTAAAELAVPVRLDLLAWLDAQEARLSHALSTGVSRRGQRLRDLSRALPRVETLVEAPRQRLDALSEALPAALLNSVQRRKLRLSEVSGILRPSLLRRGVEQDRRALQDLSARLKPATLARDVARKRQEIEGLARRFEDASSRQITRWRDRLDALERLRQTVGYEDTLRRGYAVVRGDGALVKTREAAQAAAELEIEFSDGKLRVGPGVGQGAGQTSAKPKPRKTGAADPPDQGSLF